MPARNLLHKRDVPEFRRWLLAEGGESRDTTAEWQLCQVRWGNGWIPIFSLARMPEHVSVPDTLVPLVTRFIRAKRLVSQPFQEPSDVTQVPWA